MRIGFIGAGNMARAIIGGMNGRKWLDWEKHFYED